EDHSYIDSELSAPLSRREMYSDVRHFDCYFSPSIFIALICRLYIETISSTLVESSGFLSTLTLPVNFGKRSASPYFSRIEFIPAVCEGLRVISDALTSITIFGS